MRISLWMLSGCLGLCLASAATAATWVDVPQPLVDPGLSLTSAERLRPDPHAPVRRVLPFEVAGPGGPFDSLLIHSDGRLELVRSATPSAGHGSGREVALRPPAATRAEYLVLAGRVSLGAAGWVAYQEQPQLVVVRWVDVEVGGQGRRASFEALIPATGDLRLQYYQLPAKADQLRIGYRGPDGAWETPHWPRSGQALQLHPGVLDAAIGDEPPAEMVDCSNCPVSEPSWLQEVAAGRPAGDSCAPFWDQDGDGVADLPGCSPNPPPSAACFNIAGLLRSTPTTHADTRWQFDEGDYCKDCVYRFYLLVECGTEMHFPLWDMEGLSLQITEVLSGQPIPIVCENEAAQQGGLFFEACDDPISGTPATRYQFPQYTADNTADPSLPISYGFDSGCANFSDLDADGDGQLSCGSELPLNPGGDVQLEAVVPGFSPGEEQVMDCYTQSATGLCGVYRVEVSSGGFFWELFSNCTGENAENFQIFDSCSTACQAFDPLPELTVGDLAVEGCSTGVEVGFDVTNIGCSDAAPIEYCIETNCVPPDTVCGSIPGSLAPNTTIRWTDTLDSVSCPAPFDVTVSIDPGAMLEECSESPTAAKCREIPGQDSETVPGCDCVAQIQPALSCDYTGWCDGAPAPTCSASGTQASGCGSSLEYRWWLGPVGSGVDLTGWQSSPDYVPGPEAQPGSNQYNVEVRCAGEACSFNEGVELEVWELPLVDAGRDRLVCSGDTVELGGTPTASGGLAPYGYAWSPPALVDDPSAATPTSVSLDAPTLFSVIVTDARGCSSSGSVFIDVDVPQPPQPVPNTLRAIKSGVTSSVDLSWSTSDPFSVGFRVHRGTSKAATHPQHPTAGDLVAQTFGDQVLLDGVDYHYLISGLNCAGEEGPQ